MKSIRKIMLITAAAVMLALSLCASAATPALTPLAAADLTENTDGSVTITKSADSAYTDLRINEKVDLTYFEIELTPDFPLPQSGVVDGWVTLVLGTAPAAGDVFSGFDKGVIIMFNGGADAWLDPAVPSVYSDAAFTPVSGYTANSGCRLVPGKKVKLAFRLDETYGLLITADGEPLTDVATGVPLDLTYLKNIFTDGKAYFSAGLHAELIDGSKTGHLEMSLLISKINGVNPTSENLSAFTGEIPENSETAPSQPASQPASQPSSQTESQTVPSLVDNSTGCGNRD